MGGQLTEITDAVFDALHSYSFDEVQFAVAVAFFKMIRTGHDEAWRAEWSPLLQQIATRIATAHEQEESK